MLPLIMKYLKLIIDGLHLLLHADSFATLSYENIDLSSDRR